MFEQMRTGRVSVLQELVNLPIHEKKALGIAATAGEIAQQPETWKTTRRIFEQRHSSLLAFLEAAGVTGPLEQKPTVVLTGAGTSDYIGQVLTLLLRAEWGCETQAIASTDLLTNMADYVVPGRRYLWISFSRSGDSPEGVAVLSQALERFPEVAHLVVTCNQRARMVEVLRNPSRGYAVVLDDAVNDRGLAMTSSFSNMVVFGQCLAHAWSVPAYDAIFPALVRAADAFLPIAGARAQELAAVGYKRVCVLGSGALTGVAKESALKVLEMTAGQVKTMTESVLGLRHGPMAALDKETLLVCFLSGDPRRQQYEADLLREVGDKGIVAQRVVVGLAAAHLDGCSEQFLKIPDGVPDLYRPPIDVLFGQLLGLYFSLAHGLKPDEPSPHGVISRVVAGFKIYA
jgi:tagatose-6-phosphate ketose/aldose isomerase